MRSPHRALLITGLLAAALLALAGRPRASELYVSGVGGLDPRAFPGDQRRPVVPPRRDGLRVGLEILVDGRPLPTVHYRGRTYLPVPRLGVEYRIRVWNHGPRRVAAIVSVDGLSVINGRPASVHGPGYLVEPRGSVTIAGWRKDLEQVAAFTFQERERSYARRMGHADNVGVIGLMAIEEQAWRPRWDLEAKGRSATTAGRDAPAVGGTGTGYGRDIDAPVRWVPFLRSNNRRLIVFYYDTAEALRRAGVPVDGGPVPFPRDTEFVPPPPASK